jgi:HK97 family phage major capsid protein
MSSETAAASPSTPTLAQNTLMSPKVAIGVVNISRQLRLQARADAWIARELLRTAGTTLDQAVLSGTGANGQPLGLLNMTTSTQSGTALAWAGITAMKRTAAAANVDDAEIAFLGTPAVRELLEKREKASGSGIVWDGPTMAGCRAYASTDMPSATLLCGPLSRIIVGIWGDGLQVELNPFDGTLFKSGVVQARVLMGVDVAVECDPLAFCKAATIT